MSRVAGLAPSAPRTAAACARFQLASQLRVPMEEPSDVVGCGRSLLVVGDTADELGILGEDGSFKTVRLPGIDVTPSNMEGVAYDAARGKLFVAIEETGVLLRYAYGPGDAAPRLEAKLALPYTGEDNKGIEGLAFLPPNASPTGQPQLAAVKEGKPKALVLLDGDGNGPAREVQLPKALMHTCEDFSALACDPVSGHLFLASDKSRTVVELQLVPRGEAICAELVQVLPVRDEKGKKIDKIEGIAFDPSGNLFVLAETSATLYRFERR